MEIKSNLNEGTLTVSPSGRIDSASGDSFNKYLEENVTDDVKTVSFDFSEVDFISSKGLRVLITLYKKLNGRTMEITGANTSVTEVLRISGFIKMFNVK